MAKIYAVANQKGGVGKTTTTACLGAAFAELGKKVLLADLDPQASLTIYNGLNPDALETTIYHLLLEEENLGVNDVKIPTKISNVDLLPSNLDLAGAEVELRQEMAWDRTLKDALKPVEAEYDVIILDCPPSLGVLTMNALVAAQTVIVALQCEFLALRGLKQLQAIVRKVRRKANPDLELLIFRTMLDTRTLHSREVFEEIQEVGGEQVLQNFVCRTVKFADSAASAEDILHYAKNSEAADAYRGLAKEVAAHGSKKR